jgi:uncharacterized protein DUF4838/glycosyl hydrolase family 2
MHGRVVWLVGIASVFLCTLTASGQLAGKPGSADLSIAAGGKSSAVVAVAADAGMWEKRAAEDLTLYIEKMSGAKPALANTAEAIAAALKADAPVLAVGKAALAAEPTLAASLAKVAKPQPLLRADAIAIKRAGNRVYLAGTNDDSHYYAAVELLRRWGCRWFMPGEFGECIPRHSVLTIGELDYAYAPPFEVRRYWISWVGDTTGKDEFMRRNFFSDVVVPSGHCLAQYTKELIPPGKTMFNVPISEDRTAQHVAKQLAPQFAKGENIMLGLEDGIYESDSQQDKELIALQYDKYFMTQSYTDAFMTFYNKTAEILLKESPNSQSKIGFLIYSNITLPPVRDITAAKPLVGYLAPIDIDPIHGMDDPRSGPRREYKEMLYRWAKVMQGRLAIYDYDQSMLVWRDLPNPSHQAFWQDVKHYQTAGILGVDTECRGAMATIFTNLYLRGQLLWNPDADVQALLKDFYEKFYGPAAEPMAGYWNAIFKAWADTIVTEHEYFVAPAIYTPELIGLLKQKLEAAEAAVKPLAGQPTAEARLIADRMRFTRLSFDVLGAYMAMVRAAAGEADYAAAVAAGERGLAAREQLTAMNGTFTTYKKIGESGYAWWPGEVQQYKELVPFTDGRKGQLVARLPLVWNFRRDEKDVGLKEGWEKQAVDLTWWKSLSQPVSLADRWDNPGNWEQVRSDLYLQAQGIITKDFQSYTGHGWYQTDFELTAEQTQGPVHLRFPGLFNECWLYVNGQQVSHRPFKGVWWLNDYRFEWDVDLSGKLPAGKNSVVLRIHNPHHLGGMFRRPFLYREVVGK